MVPNRATHHKHVDEKNHQIFLVDSAWLLKQCRRGHSRNIFLPITTSWNLIGCSHAEARLNFNKAWLSAKTFHQNFKSPPWNLNNWNFNAYFDDFLKNTELIGCLFFYSINEDTRTASTDVILLSLSLSLISSVFTDDFGQKMCIFRACSSCFMRATRLPFFKNFKFYTFLPKFSNILPFFALFLPSFWKIARVPLLSRIGPGIGLSRSWQICYH